MRRKTPCFSYGDIRTTNRKIWIQKIRLKELLTFLQKRDAMMSKKSAADRRSACLLIMSKMVA